MILIIKIINVYIFWGIENKNDLYNKWQKCVLIGHEVIDNLRRVDERLVEIDNLQAKSLKSLLPWRLCLSTPPSSHSLLFLLLLLPKVLSGWNPYFLFLSLFPFYMCVVYVKAVERCTWVVGFKISDGNSNTNSVKLRDDWRQKSRPIPPGGTYPAKDHCRFTFLAMYIYIYSDSPHFPPFLVDYWKFLIWFLFFFSC